MRRRLPSFIGLGRIRLGRIMKEPHEMRIDLDQVESIRGKCAFDSSIGYRSCRRIARIFPLIDAVVIHEDAVTRPFEIIKLPAAQTPPENGSDNKDKHNGHGNKEVQNFH